MQMNNLTCAIENSTAIVTITRPKALNALNRETLEELLFCFNELEQDSNVRMLQQRYGARLLTNTVKPIDRSPGETSS